MTLVEIVAVFAPLTVFTILVVGITIWLRAKGERW